MDEQLTDRKKRILKAIIKTYMETGEPVGSRTISKDADLNVSSATIRNEMADLEELGYIMQPHTSAGRRRPRAGRWRIRDGGYSGHNHRHRFRCRHYR